MRKILHVVNSLEPGGMENGVVNITRALDRRCHMTRIACLEIRGAFADRLPEHIPVITMGKGNGFTLGSVGRLRRLIKEFRPDVVHTHNLGPLIYAALATHFGRTSPILHGEHSQLSEADLSSKRLRQRRWLYRACKKIHSVSFSLQRQLLDLNFPADKLVTVVNGVDADHFVPGNGIGTRQSLQIPADAFVIGMVGRFGKFKGHAVLLKSFEKLATRHCEVHLLIVGGGGPERERIMHQASQSPYTDRIHFTGFQDDPRPFYHAMNLLVVPSTNEGLSNAVLEAMSCGLPVLAHQACGNSDVIIDSRDGFVADLSTPLLLDDKLERMVSRPHELLKIGTEARATVLTRFSLVSMVDGYEQLYDSIGG